MEKKPNVGITSQLPNTKKLKDVTSSSIMSGTIPKYVDVKTADNQGWPSKIENPLNYSSSSIRPADHVSTFSPIAKGKLTSQNTEDRPGVATIMDINMTQKWNLVQAEKYLLIIFQKLRARETIFDVSLG